MSNIHDKMTDKLDIMKIVDLYFQQKNILYTHQHNSFNQFMEEYIPHILKNESNIFYEKVTQTEVIRNKFKFDDIYIKPPMIENENEMMFPIDARTRSLTYASLLIATVTQVQERIDIASGKITEIVVGKIEKEVPVARIPVMVGSKFCSLNIRKDVDKTECEYDMGGYFIIKGSEKVVMSLERMIDNKPLVFIKKDQSNKIYTIQVNSRNFDTDNMQIFSIKLKKNESMTLKIPQFAEIPIFILIRVLGIEFDREIIDCITQGNADIGVIEMIRVSLDNSVDDNGTKIISKEAAIEYLLLKMKVPRIQYTETDLEIKHAQKKMHLMKLLEQDILPHVSGIINKGYYICYMIGKLLKCYLGNSEPDNRDSFTNKRVDTPGVLIGQLFKQYYKKMFNECNKFFKKRNTDDNTPLNIISQIKPNVIEQGLRTALATGSWGGNKNKKGVAQLLGRLSFLQTISYLRRVQSSTTDSSTQTLTGPRHIHNSQYGFICPVETPEGHNVGLVKSLAMMSSITLTVKSQVIIIKNELEDKVSKLVDIPVILFKKYVKVFLNGEWIGLTDDPITIVNKLKLMRKMGQLEKTVSIILEPMNKEIKIYCDGGRLYRPLLKVNDNKIELTEQHILDVETKKIKKWSQLLVSCPDIIEYVDVEESEYLMIAMYPKDVQKNYETMNNVLTNTDATNFIIDRYNDNVYVRYTHCEFHPSLMLGAIASSIPFCNHNVSPRNIYQYSQARQAMGIYTSNYRDRLDISYILYHPQTPLVMTRAAKYNNTDRLAAGENITVAICCYSGYNQEDSVIVNQSSIDRGLFRSTAYKKYQDTISKNPTTSRDDIFLKPDRLTVTGMKNTNYDKLNDKGYVPEETPIVNNDIIIGKVSPIQPSGNSNKVFKDSSKVYKSNVKGVIDRVWTGIYDSTGYEMYKMRVREERVPVIGDKFSSRMGQKGTMGISFRQEDMPFTKDGVTPDIIINPNCLSGDSVILLDDGDVTTIKNIVDGHNYSVKTVNPDTFELSNTKIENEFMIIPNKKMYKIRTWSGREIKCTTDHPFLVYDGFKSIWKTAEDLEPNKDKIMINHMINVLSDTDGELINISDFEQYEHYIEFKKCGLTEIINVNQMKILAKLVGALTKSCPPSAIPKWILKAPSSVKRAFLLGFQSSNKFDINSLEQIEKNNNKQYIYDLAQLFNDLGILTHITNECEYILNLLFFSDNLNKYFDTIGYNDKYNNETNMFMYIEHLKSSINGYNIEYNKFIECFQTKNNKVCIFIESIEEIELEPVYDFTTVSDNHSFIANSFIVHNCIPSRMTIAQLIECVLGKVSAINGYESDGTPFNDIDVDSIRAELKKLGFDDSGKEYLYNGMNGQKMKSMIFIGPTYYQRLKHLVHDKIHSRSRGPYQLLTHQPPEGRSRDGGLRFGEMERDCIIAHGMGQFLKERMVETSDKYSMYICDICGFIAQRAKNKEVYMCKQCNNNTDISKIQLTYAYKLLMQEMMSMNIAPRIKIKKTIYND